MEKGLKLPRGVKRRHWPVRRFSCLQGGRVQEAGLGGELEDLELLSDSPSCSCTCTGHDCSLRLWSLDNKTCVQEITAHRKKHEEAIHAVACHPSKALIASAGADALAKVFV